MNADAVAALLHDVLGAECSGTHSLGYATCQRQAAALAAIPLPSDPTHPHDGFAYDGCKCVCCVNIRALANPAIIEERDRAEEWADRLAYAIGGAAIGEHSNLNNPWQNALDMATPLPSDTPADGLDVERLIYAVHQAINGVPAMVVTNTEYVPQAKRRADAVVDRHRVIVAVRDAIREYAALALTQEPRSTREEADPA